MPSNRSGRKLPPRFSTVLRSAQKCGVDVEAYLVWLFEHEGSHRDRLGRSQAQLTPMAYRDFLAEQGARAA